MNDFLLHYLTLWKPLGYLLVFIGMIFEGDVVFFTAAFLTHQGFFGIGEMLFAAASGVLIGDLLWFEIGRKLKAESSFRKWTDHIAKPFDHHMQARPFHTIFLSKFAYGLGHVMLFRAGTLNFSLKNFIKNDARATLLWGIIVGGLGYLSSASFVLAGRYLRLVSFGVLFLWIIIFVWGHRIIAEQLKREVADEKNEN